jgi:hypothetical protein
MSRTLFASIVGWFAVLFALASAAVFADCVPLAFAGFLVVTELQRAWRTACASRAAWCVAAASALLAVVGLTSALVITTGVIAKQTGGWSLVDGAAPTVAIALMIAGALAALSRWLGDARSHIPLLVVVTVSAYGAELALSHGVTLVACAFAATIATGLAFYTWRHAVIASHDAGLQQRLH